ncbi:hypothetical protein LXM94_23830 [Rhizobium sp. TRM95111]|uniref:hypothetical protein n=1 Tax=Rhizobium alarense TaxID=2846851 RepID=UPI001F375C83|nr:hypothetical protein [Rhizobium alarense]MCF3642997.1 hypothetical protein [Rhizobium alarense]
MSDDRELKDQRIPIMMTESEVKKIDDWSFQQRIRSRGEAIRRLCQIGLAFDEGRETLLAGHRSIASAVDAALAVGSDPNEIKSLTTAQKVIVSNAIKALVAATHLLPILSSQVIVDNYLKSEGDIDYILKNSEKILSLYDKYHDSKE